MHFLFQQCHIQAPSASVQNSLFKLEFFPQFHIQSHSFWQHSPLSVWTPTFADETLLGDGLLADVAALGLLEGLQLEGVCVDALQLVGLRGEEEGRGIRREPANRNTFSIRRRQTSG